MTSDPHPSPPPPASGGVPWAAVLVATAVVAAVWVVTPVIPLNGGWDADGRFYGMVLLVFEGAAGIGEVPGPWRWRPLAPFLASLLPLDPLTAFRVLGMVSAGAGLVVLYALARRTGLPPRQSLFAMILYAGIFWTVKFPAWSPAYVDAETQLLLLVGLLLARDGRTAALVALLVLGGLQKESLAVLAVPAWVAWIGRSREAGGGLPGPGPGRPGRPGLGRLVALAAVPVVVALALRLAFPHPEGAPRPPGPLAGLSAVLATDGATVRLALAPFSGLGLLWALPLASPRTALTFLRREPFWAVQIPLGCVLLLGGVDKARLFLYMAPAMAVLGAVVCHGVHRRLGASAAALGTAWLVLTLLVHLWLGHHLRPMGDVAEYLARLVPVHAPSVPLRSLATASVLVGAWGAVTAALLAGFPAGARAPHGRPG